MYKKKRQWFAGLLALMVGISVLPISSWSADAAFEGWVVDENQ